MGVLLGFAFLAGVVTIASPCILPALPILLSGTGGGRARPLGVVVGFVASFTAFTLALAAIVRALGIPVNTLRIVAVVFIVLFGLVMLVPWLRNRFEMLTAGIGRRAGASGPAHPGKRESEGWRGLASGLAIGFSLGLIWTPCVGPIMASIISLALTLQVDGGSVLITLAYAIGTAIPMFGVMLGGQALLKRVKGLARHAGRIQQGFGILMILVGVAVGLGWDRRFQAAVLAAFPGYGAGLTAIESGAPVRTAIAARTPALPLAASVERGAGTFIAPDEEPHNAELSDYGAAPEFIAKGPWLNTEGVVPAAVQMPGGTSIPLSLAALRGRVVVVDFWTYSCVNCIRTIPYLRAWYETYRNKGLVIVGVHTPEFEFEKKTGNVSQAMRDLGVTWPVVQDNDYAEWNAYGNRYWPSKYFIDAKGRVRYFHFGEGDYDVGERVIQKLLAEAGAAGSGGAFVSKPAPSIDTMTPETYLGYGRGRGFASAVAPVADAAVDYLPARVPANAEWNLTGPWTITEQYSVPESTGTLQLGFEARNVFLVIEPQDRGSISVFVDDRPAGDTVDVRKGVLTPRESRMYQLVGLGASGPHVLRLEVRGRLRLFAFTFG